MVEKMEVDEPSKATDAKKETKPEPTKADLDAITYESKLEISLISGISIMKDFIDLKDWCTQLERGDVHIVGRVLQFLAKTRKELNIDILTKLITTFVQEKSQRDLLFGFVAPNLVGGPEPMDVDKTKAPRSPRPDRRPAGQSSKPTGNPEVELYIQLLTIVYLLDNGKLDAVDQCAKNYIQRIDLFDKRSLDTFLAKGFFYLTLVAERQNRIADLRGLVNFV